MIHIYIYIYIYIYMFSLQEKLVAFRFCLLGEVPVERPLAEKVHLRDFGCASKGTALGLSSE